ncbi:hypothetical protein SAMN02745163_02330 [Clostridium cavendishii DSM 21758]|uniref:CobW/HypB/UreG nucleotide-binding domain-containing protein n=1 Tax=Clostridium cavendishii DSM 21758 TaxID=1121302 RepID=A0A1M6KY23_9CLOT|nr:permease [Clostridium cavendishii]SHJ63809.1 hypothetical protein SAMN02745163_02330 [Clostridium cavendishii DSM 21758]
MKIAVDIITGFLGAGKTKLINSMLENKDLSKETIVIIQCETGETEITCNLIENKNIVIKNINKEILLDAKYINNLVKEYQPNRIIIEANGMEKLQNLLNTFDDPNINRLCLLNRIINTIDALTFDIFMNNISSILVDQISNSDFIVINNTDNFTKENLKNIKKTLKRINKSAKIVRSTLNEENMIICDDKILSIENSEKLSNLSDKLIIPFLILCFGYLIFSALKPIEFNMNRILSWLQVFNTVFLGILVQAFPFILVGVFISAIIQVFVSSELITRFFPKKMGLGFVVAIFAGFLFPVCDCAIVPVGARLVKKGVALPVAITFMLTAPIVNPIVIISTLCAFPGQTYITLYRIYFGIVIALLVGLVFRIFPEQNSILLNKMDTLTCGCEFCSDNNSKGMLKKVDTIFKHAGVEFFQVGKFLIMGAFISSMMQTIIPKNILASLGGGAISSLLTMMMLAFILSVCSTSDAFIARTFINQFPMGSVIGFLILGPMVDIKNLLMLLGSFEKRFVVKLVLIIFTVSFVILLFATKLFQVR